MDVAFGHHSLVVDQLIKKFELTPHTDYLQPAEQAQTTRRAGE